MKRFLIFAYLFVLAVSGVPASEEGADWDYEGENGPEYWVGFHNFYVITRYNRSTMYAMAVYQLAETLAEKKRPASQASARHSDSYSTPSAYPAK